MGAIEVRAAADRNADPAARVSGQKRLFQAGPQLPLGAARPARTDLCHRAARRAVHVEVVSHHENRIGGGSCDHALGHGGQDVLPMRVRYIRRVIDDRCIPAGVPNVIGLQDVGRDRLDAVGPWLRGSAADRPHAPAFVPARPRGPDRRRRWPRAQRGSLLSPPRFYSSRKRPMTITMICYPAAGKAIRRSAHSNLFGCAEVVIPAISPLTRCPRCDSGSGQWARVVRRHLVGLASDPRPWISPSAAWPQRPCR
jgi:hypothetical protein